MSDDDLIEASPCKLHNGDWGCKTQEPVEAGTTVRIVTRANKQWQATVTQVVWTDNQVCICATESAKSGQGSGKGPGQGQGQGQGQGRKQQDKNKDESKAQGPSKGERSNRQSGPGAGAAATSRGKESAQSGAFDAAPPAPPRPGAMASDELDAMADRAAEQDDDFDELMNAQQDFESGPR